MMASCHPLGSLAICSSICHLPSQHAANSGGWIILTWTFQLNQNWSQDEAYAHLWMSCVCTAKWTCFRRINPALVTTRTSRGQFGSNFITCQKRQLGFEFAHGMGLTTIPLQIWWFLWNCEARRTWCQRSIGMATIIRTCYSNSSTIFGISQWIWKIL